MSATMLDLQMSRVCSWTDSSSGSLIHYKFELPSVTYWLYFSIQVWISKPTIKRREMNTFSELVQMLCSVQTRCNNVRQNTEVQTERITSVIWYFNRHIRTFLSLLKIYLGSEEKWSLLLKINSSFFLIIGRLSLILTFFENTWS